MSRLEAGAGVETPCVWVGAGVLGYRPCDRAFDCEACPLFRALRAGGGHDEQGGAGLRAADDGRAAAVLRGFLTGCRVHLDRSYSAAHLWVQDTDGHLMLGIDDLALRVLYPLDEVTVVRPGVLLAGNEPLGWMVRGRVVVSLRSPVAGEILDANTAYLDAVRGQDRPAHPEPWLLRIKPTTPTEDAKRFMRGEATLDWYLGQISALRANLQEALDTPPQHEVGATLADGGVATGNLEAVLGRTRFEALVNTLFRDEI